jgi:simple sugar transport system ATP-binding protein
MLDPPSDGSDHALRLRHISKTFGGVHALRDVSLEVRVGEVHCLAGENGCGKSTLIKIITGVYIPEDGAEIDIFGERLTSITPVIARDRGIAVIWQDLALFPEMTVAENIAFDQLVGGWPRRVKHGKLRELAGAVLARLDVQLDLDAPLHTLAIAQRQIVAIARALAGEARLIFMDEPTASLTQSETDNLLAIVRALSNRGVAVVFVSHRLAEVLEIAKRVTVVRDGRLVGVYDTAGMTQSRLTELMTGQLLTDSVRARDFAGKRAVLEVEGLSRKDEFQNIDLTVREGEIVGLTGLLGAGRTELAHVLFGMHHPDAGIIRLDGHKLNLRSNRQAIEAGIAYVSEDRLTLGLIQPQSIADNMVLSVLSRLSDRLGLVSESKKESLVNYWHRELAIKIGKVENPVSTLSGGNQQRVVLAKWLATEPKLLILDSPTVGVDVGARAGIFDIVRRLAEAGLAILLISDEVPEVYFNADRVVHMASGAFVAEYDPRRMGLQEMEAAIYA